VSSAKPTASDGAKSSSARPSQANPLVAVALLCALLGGFAAYAATARPANLNQAQKADVQRIEEHLNGLRTLQSRFLQVSSNGAVAEGTVYIQRPGRMRIEYDPPMPVLIVADGSHLIYFDKELEQVTHVGLDSSPAGILLQEKVTLSGDLTVTKFERGPSVLRATVVRTKDANEGNLTLVFSDNPLALRKWTVVDPQGVATEVSLQGPQLGGSLKPELFRFTAPVKPQTGK
jgi:outer membrane lipoprotein-sorting protein